MMADLKHNRQLIAPQCLNNSLLLKKAVIPFTPMAKNKANNNNHNNDKSFPIVGIGGSAGAIQAVIEIVENLTSHTGMSFIYLQHQTPDFESKMVQLLSKKSKV